jgi:alcohol dehydrogenase
LTAYQALNKLDVKKGDHVLITAGAGGVGLLAIQLAKLRGATVATTASPAGESYVKKAGADEVINYRETKLSSLGPTFDKVFDLAAHSDAEMQETFAAVKKGGKVLTVSGPPAERVRGRRPAVVEELARVHRCRVELARDHQRCKGQGH